MDLSALVSPMLSFLQSLSAASSSPSNHPIMNASTIANLDRTLGTMASLGLTFAVYKSLERVMKNLTETGHTFLRQQQLQQQQRNSNSRQEEDLLQSKVMQAIKLMLRRIFMGAGVKRIASASDGTGQRQAGQALDDEELITLQGSCHCNAISFIVKAPRYVQARDSQGKIQYPHFISNAETFQLTRGTRYLSIYYVDSSSSSSSFSTPSHQFQQRPPSNSSSIMSNSQGKPAAHTFCKKCGVHILRVPDPDSNVLEVNTNCLDGGSSFGEATMMATTTMTANHQRAIQYEFDDDAIEVTTASKTTSTTKPLSTSIPISTTMERILPTLNTMQRLTHQREEDYVDSSWTIDTTTLQGSRTTTSSNSRAGEEDPSSTANGTNPFHPLYITKKRHVTSTSSQQNTATTETPSSFASSIHRLDSALSSASETSSCDGLSFDDDVNYDKSPAPPRELSLERVNRTSSSRAIEAPGGGIWSSSTSGAGAGGSHLSSSRSNGGLRSYFRTDSGGIGSSGSSGEQEPYKSPLVMRDQLKYYMTKHLK